MTALVDTSVLVDYLRGHQAAGELLEQERATAPLHASEITRLEILAGMRPGEEDATRSLLSTRCGIRSTNGLPSRQVRWAGGGFPAIAPLTVPTSPLLPPRSSATLGC